MASEKNRLLKDRSLSKKVTPVNKKVEFNTPPPPSVTFQRTLGNSAFGSILQSKLKVNEPGDIYEKEADRVADEVVRMPNPGIQMKCEECEEEDGLHRQTMIQLSGSAVGGAQPVPTEISSKISSTRGSGQSLKQETQKEMGSKIGADFSGVKIHTDNTAVQLSQNLGSKAFTVGNDIYFNEGQYTPGSTEGKRLLAHELVHTVQQMSDSGVSLLIQRQHELETEEITQFTTPSGNFYRFSAPQNHTNYNNRPRFLTPESHLVTYTGIGNNGVERVHPTVVPVLERMMTAMQSEGNRINDESLKQSRVDSAYRPSSVREGRLYLDSLKRTIRENPNTFGALTFPVGLEEMARSELGPTGSDRHNQFVNTVANQSGWNPTLAKELVRITGKFKAPRGASTHHSGLVVDINFPYATSNSNVEPHKMSRNRNANAQRSAAGVWLTRYSTNFDFDTYDTNAEIWHQEWREWAGTSADPAVNSETTAPEEDTSSPEVMEETNESEAVQSEESTSEELPSTGVEEVSETAETCALTTFSASNFVGDTVTADVEFVDSLENINTHALRRNIEIYVTHSFREAGQTVSGAIVEPANHSNHLAGHAIDMNLKSSKGSYNSTKLRRANLVNLPENIRGFIHDIRDDSGLRWGGDFTSEDPVHIDDHLNSDISEWKARYDAVQGSNCIGDHTGNGQPDGQQQK